VRFETKARFAVPPRADQVVGTELAGYRILALLGRGGMSTVYLAEDNRLGRKVALKLLAHELAEDERFRTRFLRESRLAASIDHSSIVPVYEAGEVDGVLYIAMRRVEGTDLRQLLRKEGPLEPERALFLLAQVGDALDIAHAKGLVHRDVKPSNILVARESGREHCYLSDFGLTKSAASLGDLTEAGHLLGTIDYVAPEQIEGASVDGRADVYSLSCVLYECLTGQVPFPRESDFAALWAHVQDAPPSVHELRPELPPALDAVVAKAMAKEREERYPSCGELVTAARAALAGELQPEARTAHRKLVVVAAIVAIALLGGGLVALGISQGTRSHGLDSLAANSVGLIDSGSGRISSDILIGGRPSAVAAGAGSLWIANAADGTVARIDPESHDIYQIPVGAGPTAISFSNGSAWVANNLDRTVSRIAADTNRVIDVIPVGNGARAIAADADAVWVANGVDSTITRIDVTTRKVTKPIPVGAVPSGIAIADGSVWVTSESTGTVTRLDSRGVVLDTVRVGNAPSAIVSGEDALWVTNAQDATVSRIDPETGSVTDVVRTGRNPRALAVGDGAVWVANADDGTLSKIDATSRRVVDTVTLASSPTALAVSGDSVWATTVSTTAGHRGGTLRVEMTGGWVCECFDPTGVWGPFGLMANAYDGLVGYRRVAGTQGGSLVPDLATDVPVPTDGGKTYAFQLRPGIRFSDGRPVRASDVRASFERIYRISSPGDGLYTGIVGADACAKHRSRCDLSGGIEADDGAGIVVVHLTRPDPDFLFKLAMSFASVVPADSPRRMDSHLPGTGPYKIASFHPSELRLVRNPYFRVWSQDAQPAGYPDEILVHFGRTPAHQIEVVTSGTADYAFVRGKDLPQERVTALATRFPGQFHTDPVAEVEYVYLRVTLPPFDDPRVRRALNYAVDRRRLVSILGGNLAAQPTCQMLSPNLPGYEPYCPYTLDPNPAGTWTAPDIAKATHLIAQSGTKGMDVRVIANAERARIGRYFVTLLRRLGYRPSLKVFSDIGEYWDYAFGHEHRTQIAAVNWVADYLAPANFLTQFGCRPLLGYLNDSEFCNPRIDALMRRAANAQLGNPALALGLWAKADRAVADEAPAVFLANPRGISLVSKRVGNFQTHPLYGPLLDQLWVE
jgi:YVTN family beta-propeller protein